MKESMKLSWGGERNDSTKKKKVLSELVHSCLRQFGGKTKRGGGGSRRAEQHLHLGEKPRGRISSAEHPQAEKGVKKTLHQSALTKRKKIKTHGTKGRTGHARKFGKERAA